MISPFPAMFTSHVIGSIEAAGFTALVRPAVFPPISLPVLSPIFSPVQLSTFAANLSAIVGHIADIVPPTTPTVIAIATRSAIG